MAETFLMLNGYVLGASDAELVVAFQALAAGELSEAELGEWVQGMIDRRLNTSVTLATEWLHLVVIGRSAHPALAPLFVCWSFCSSTTRGAVDALYGSPHRRHALAGSVVAFGNSSAPTPRHIVSSMALGDMKHGR